MNGVRARAGQLGDLPDQSPPLASISGNTVIDLKCQDAESTFTGPLASSFDHQLHGILTSDGPSSHRICGSSQAGATRLVTGSGRYQRWRRPAFTTGAQQSAPHGQRRDGSRRGCRRAAGAPDRPCEWPAPSVGEGNERDVASTPDDQRGAGPPHAWCSRSASCGRSSSSVRLRRVAAARSAVASALAVIPAPSAAGPETYASITTQNLFNPVRGETATMAALAVVKPILHGIVIEGAKSRAFLEDPSAKRVAGYSLGDPVAGGKLQKIADDRVVISRPEGLVEVLLQDPAKPRPTPTAPPVAPVVAGAPGQPAPGQPGSPPAAGQLGPVQGASAPAVLPPAGVTPGQAAVTPAYDQVLGQVMPAPVLGNQLSATPSQSRRRAAAPGQQANRVSR